MTVAAIKAVAASEKGGRKGRGGRRPGQSPPPLSTTQTRLYLFSSLSLSLSLSVGLSVCVSVCVSMCLSPETRTHTNETAVGTPPLRARTLYSSPSIRPYPNSVETPASDPVPGPGSGPALPLATCPRVAVAVWPHCLRVCARADGVG